jgi:hypothetical protein
MMIDFTMTAGFHTMGKGKLIVAQVQAVIVMKKIMDMQVTGIEKNLITIQILVVVACGLPL